MSIGDLIVSTAMKYNGLKEAPGAANNPAVVEFYAKSGHAEIKQDSVPWCAAFVGAVLAECGLQGTGSLLAQSYRKWGEKVSHDDVQPGDLAVIPRGSEPWQGHIFIVTKVAADRVEGIGGNQSDMVSIKTYYKSQVFPDGFRRAALPRSSLVSSTTLQAAGVSGTAVVGGAASLMSALGPQERMVLIVAGLVILAGLAYIARERIKAWGRGVR